LRRVPVLADLSRLTLDNLALRLRRETVPANTTIVRQGEPGDKVYLIRSGEASVLVSNSAGNEAEVEVLHSMDYFGEVALLRDVPRTATVRARGRVQLFSLTRADFQEVLGRSEALRETVLRTSDARYLRAALFALR
jgi:CRP-like cAMP-binding protein